MKNKIQYYKFLSDLYLLASRSYNQDFKYHKFILLLSIIELFDNNYFIENKIYLDKALLNSYTKHINYFSKTSSSIRPWYPFYHLRSSPFWNHKIKLNMEYSYKILKSEQGLKAINSVIEYGYFEENVFLLIMDEKIRSKIENLIISILIENLDESNE